MLDTAQLRSKVAEGRRRKFRSLINLMYLIKPEQEVNAQTSYITFEDLTYRQ